MSQKGNLSESLEKGKVHKKKNLYSKAYHRHFRGYSEVVVPKSNGRGSRIERIYTGDLYRQDLNKKKRIGIRVLYVALFILSTVLFVLGAIYPHPINITLYVVIPQAISLGFLFWIFVIFYNYLPAPEEMTITEYLRSSRYLLIAALGATIALGVLALASLIFIFLKPSEESLRILLCVFEYIFASVFTLVIFLVEKRVRYIKYPSENQPPEGSYEIA